MIEVQGPDGQRLRFPDGTSRETMRAAMAKRYPPTAAKPAPKAPTGFGFEAAQRLIDLAAASKGRAEGDAAKRLAKRDMRGVSQAQGLFFNAADEIEGAGAFVETAAKNGLRRLMGDEAPYTSRQAYDATRERYDAYAKADAKSRPVGSMVDSMIGGLVPAVVGTVATGGGSTLPMLSRLPAAVRLAVASSALGAGGGAVSGGMGAEPGKRADGAKSGALVGGAVGAVLPAAVGVGARALAPVVDPVVRRAAPVLQDTVARLSGREGGAAARAAAERLTKPEQRAALAIERIRARDAAGGHVETPDIAPYQGGGQGMVGLAELVAQSPGPGANLVRREITRNQAATQNAIKGDIGESLGGRGDYFAHLDEQRGARSGAAKPLFDEAFAQPLDADTFNTEFGALVSRLPKGAMERAADLARRDGFDPYELGLIRSDTFDGFAPGAARVEAVNPRDLKSLQRGVEPGTDEGYDLMSFIARNGGLSDEGGDLAAMGAQNWHVGKPFAPRLVRDDGSSLDDMAQRAHEAGYFPERAAPTMDDAENMQPISPAELMEAMREGLAGNRRFARTSETADRRARLSDLEERMNQAGVDPRQVNARQAGEALGGYADDEARFAAHLDGEAPGMSPDELLPVQTPTLRTAHYIKKAMDQELEQYRSGVTGRLDLDNAPDAQATNRVRGAWAEKMREVSEPYRKAMTQWGDDSENLDAFKLGGNVLSETFDMQSEQVRRVWTGLSEEGRREYSKGVGEAILRKVRSTGGGVAAMRKLLRNEDIADKVRLAFPGPSAFEDFMARASTRVDHEARNAQVWGNSRTFARGAAADDLTLNDEALDAAIEAATLNLAGLGKRAIKGVLGRKGQTILDDPTSNMALARAVTNVSDRDNLLRLMALQRARSIGANTSGVSGYLAAPTGAVVAGER